jgi:hypothetical protein
MLSYKLDWISATMMQPAEGHKAVREEREAMHIMTKVLKLFSVDKRSRIKKAGDPVPPYRWSYQIEGIPGFFYIPLEAERMGVGFRATGNQLQNFKDGFVAHTLLRDAGAKFTRLDFAFDFMSHGEDMRALSILAREMLEDKRTTAFYQMNGQPSGYTVGSRSSEMYVRVYDKALEQGKDYRWIRCELEVKGQRAIEFGKTLSTGFMKASSYVLERAIPARTSLEDDLLSTFADGIACDTLPPRAASNRERWLWGDVKSSFVKLIKENPDAAIDYIQGLSLILSLELDRMGHTSLT